MRSLAKIAAALLLAATAISGWAETGTPPGDAALCLGCHDYGPDSPVHQVQAGSHGIGEAPISSSMSSGGTVSGSCSMRSTSLR